MASRWLAVPNNRNQLPLNHRIRVLRSFQPFFHLINVYDPDNFQNKTPKAIKYSIFKAFAVFIPFFMHFLTLSLNCWTCIAYQFDWLQNAYQIVVILCTTQQLIIYLALLMKARQIHQTIECLQQTVDYRKLLVFNIPPPHSIGVSEISGDSFFGLYSRNRSIVQALCKSRTAICFYHNDYIQKFDCRLHCNLFGAITTAHLICDIWLSGTESVDFDSRLPVRKMSDLLPNFCYYFS